MRVSLIFGVAALSAQADVLTLTGSNFADTLKDHTASPTKQLFVNFKAPWCVESCAVALCTF